MFSYWSFPGERRWRKWMCESPRSQENNTLWLSAPPLRLCGICPPYIHKVLRTHGLLVYAIDTSLVGFCSTSIEPSQPDMKWSNLAYVIYYINSVSFAFLLLSFVSFASLFNLNSSTAYLLVVVDSLYGCILCERRIKREREATICWNH